MITEKAQFGDCTLTLSRGGSRICKKGGGEIQKGGGRVANIT